MTEVWRMVSGFEGQYEISDIGRVRSVSRRVRCRDGDRLLDGKVLTPSGSPYLQISLYDGARTETRLVHRMVAVAFVPGDGPVVRHLDGTTLNNEASNLAWSTHKENAADKKIHGTHLEGTNHPNAKLSAFWVLLIRKLSTRGLSQVEISKETGINRGTVGKIVRGESYKNVC